MILFRDPEKAERAKRFRLKAGLRAPRTGTPELNVER